MLWISSLACGTQWHSAAAEMVLPAPERLPGAQHMSNQLKFYGLHYKADKTYGFSTWRSCGSLIGYCLLDETYFWMVTAHVRAPNLSQMQSNVTSLKPPSMQFKLQCITSLFGWAKSMPCNCSCGSWSANNLLSLLNHGNAAAELPVRSRWSNSSFQQQSPKIRSQNGQHKGKGIMEQQGGQQWFASVTALPFYFNFSMDDGGIFLQQESVFKTLLHRQRELLM